MRNRLNVWNRELKFKGTIIDFYQDTMEINGDHTVVWDFIKHKGAAAVVPVTEDGKILSTQNPREGEKHNGSGGGGGWGEREGGGDKRWRGIEEETGYKSEELEWLITLRTTVAFLQ